MRRANRNGTPVELMDSNLSAQFINFTCVRQQTHGKAGIDREPHKIHEHISKEFIFAWLAYFAVNEAIQSDCAFQRRSVSTANHANHANKFKKNRLRVFGVFRGSKCSARLSLGQTLQLKYRLPRKGNSIFPMRIFGTFAFASLRVHLSFREQPNGSV